MSSRVSTADRAFSGRVRVELDTQQLAALMAQGQLCVADLHCLDAESRNQLKQLCLSACVRHCRGPEQPRPLRLIARSG